MLNKLRNRILLLNLVITSLVMLLAFAAVYLTTQNNVQIEERNKLDSLSGIDSEFLLNDWQSSNLNMAFIVTVDGKGEIRKVYTTHDSFPDSRYADAVSAALGEQTGEFTNFTETWRYRVQNSEHLSETISADAETVSASVWPAPAGATSELLTIAFLDVTENRAALNNLLFNLVIIGIIMLIVIYIISRYVAGRAIRPVAKAWEQQKRFVADASHELKTPLMTIMANCDVLEANEDESIKSQREWLESIKLGADRMGRLIGNLLTLARIESAELSEQKQDFNLHGLVQEVVRSLDSTVQAKQLHVSIASLPPQLEALGYRDSIQQVVTILYDNAVKYAEQGGTIELSARRTGKQIDLSVRNTGQGITQEDLPQIFDRFYRADTARNAEDNSYGLGLSIALSIAERIGGQLKAKSEPGAWTEFSFIFDA